MQRQKNPLLKNEESQWNFPGGPVVRNLPSNAKDTGLTPGQGPKVPDAAGQLSPHATTTETLSTPEPVSHSERFRLPQLRPDEAK